ncbi:pantothenate synthase [Ascosphaera acerosa]|nr:pantothenate synthase [Ascosphaera acerosa]
MKIFRTVSPLRDFRRQLLLADRRVGLVPTMGALHDGHLSLIRRAAQDNSDVLVSIFVNPTQFGVNEDLDSYPRTWDADLEKLRALNRELDTAPAHARMQGRIAAIFAPTTAAMYPASPPSSEVDGHGTFVTTTPLSRLLEGASRPVFFRGVATVCTKLFNIVQPERVYFGQKDIQQTLVIRRLVEDLHINTEVVVVPTVREADGLAMSSRNVYLGSRRRAVGLVLHQCLAAASAAYDAGARSRADILGKATAMAESVSAQQAALPPGKRALFDVDYISLADPSSMEELDVVDPTRGAVLSGAIKMRPIEDPQEDEDKGLGGGSVPVRLIDNMILQPLKTGN